MKIENATLKESMDSMEHLTSSIHRLRLSLWKVSYYLVPKLWNFCIWKNLGERTGGLLMLGLHFFRAINQKLF